MASPTRQILPDAFQLGDPSRRGAACPNFHYDYFRQAVEVFVGDVRVTAMWPRDEPAFFVDRVLPEMEPKPLNLPALPGSTTAQRLITHHDSFLFAVAPRILNPLVWIVAVGYPPCNKLLTGS